MYTVQSCSSADGTFIPPMVVYKGKTFFNEWCLDGPLGAGYTHSKSGWMEGEQFFQWFRDIFVKHTDKQEGKT